MPITAESRVKTADSKPLGIYYSQLWTLYDGI